MAAGVVCGRDERREQFFSAGKIWHVASQERRLLGQRPDFQRQLRDHAQRAQRAGEQFAKVVAGHVFHDPAAPFERHSPAVDGG